MMLADMDFYSFLEHVHRNYDFADDWDMLNQSIWVSTIIQVPKNYFLLFIVFIPLEIREFCVIFLLLVFCFASRLLLLQFWRESFRHHFDHDNNVTCHGGMNRYFKMDLSGNKMSFRECKLGGGVERQKK